MSDMKDKAIDKHNEQPQAHEGELARALEDLRHSDACHAEYVKFKAIKTDLGYYKRSCSKCLTKSPTGRHSDECIKTYSAYLQVKASLKLAQEICKKCIARACLQENLNNVKSK